MEVLRRGVVWRCVVEILHNIVGDCLAKKAICKTPTKAKVAQKLVVYHRRSSLAYLQHLQSRKTVCIFIKIKNV